MVVYLYFIGFVQRMALFFVSLIRFGKTDRRVLR